MGGCGGTGNDGEIMLQLYKILFHVTSTTTTTTTYTPETTTTTTTAYPYYNYPPGWKLYPIRSLANQYIKWKKII